MARMTPDRRAELEQTLPPLEVTVAKVRDYMSKADMSMPQFAKLAGYAMPTLRCLLNGSYALLANSDVAIRHALEQFMLHNPVGQPVESKSGRLYETENVRELRRWFEHCHEHQALACVYGPPGSQKTYVTEHLVAEFNRRELHREDTRNRAYLVRCSINIQPRDLMAKICTEVGAYTGNTLQKCLTSLRLRLRGTKTVIVLDEAQLCGIPALEAVRELHDCEPGVGILLEGSHALKKFFDARAAELEQWNSRLDAVVELCGVSDQCARAILAIEIPDLDAADVDSMIADSKVQDIYSRDRARTYLNMRRLFKNIAALRRLEAEAEEATA